MSAPPSKAAVGIFAAFLFCGALVRLVALEVRPLHGDEAVGAFLSLQVRETGSYVYESANRHGPLQYYVGGAAMRLLGESDSAIRFPHALAGSLLPLALIGFRRRLADTGWLLAGGLLSFSPAFVYFSRYAIQEIDFTLATLLLLASGLAFASSGSRGSLFVLPLSAAWMVTLKETFVIVWGCLGLSLALAFLVGGERSRAAFRDAMRRLKGRLVEAATGILAGLLLVAAAYSDGFRNPAGLQNLGSNLYAMVRFGAATPSGLLLHRHPVTFYLALLLRYEWPILLLAAIGLCAGFRDRRPGILIVALYALLVTGVHFALPYKIPWLLLMPLLPLTVLAGYGGARLLQRWWPESLHSRGALLAATLVPFLCLPQSLTLSFLHPADPAEPMVYHQAGPGQEALAQDILRLISRVPDEPPPRARICLPYVWPLAWYLRHRDDIVFERFPVPPRPAAERIPVVVTLERADPRFLEAFVGSRNLPRFSLPHYLSRTYVLIPPDYNVARLWARPDLAPAGFSE